MTRWNEKMRAFVLSSLSSSTPSHLISVVVFYVCRFWNCAEVYISGQVTPTAPVAPTPVPPSPTPPDRISVVVNSADKSIDRRSSPRHRRNLDIQDTLYSLRRLSSIASGWYLEEDSDYEEEEANDEDDSRDDFEEHEEDPNDPDAKWRVTV